MPLTRAGAGAAGTVQRICGRDETRRFLASLGFVEGAAVTVVSAMAGSLIVCIKDTRVALSQQMASRIMIG